MNYELLQQSHPFLAELVSRTYTDEREMQEALNFVVSRARCYLQALKKSAQNTHHDWVEWLDRMKLELVSRMFVNHLGFFEQFSRKLWQCSLEGLDSTIGASQSHRLSHSISICSKHSGQRLRASSMPFGSWTMGRRMTIRPVPYETWFSSPPDYLWTSFSRHSASRLVSDPHMYMEC
jgi:hypothetical protein